uniref:Uncharacterized protein n=1 Tax=Rhizophora mucronata TaxID=61149 RepID=A0A2P2QX24_RHIMU
MACTKDRWRSGVHRSRGMLDLTYFLTVALCSSLFTDVLSLPELPFLPFSFSALASATP